MSFLLLRQKDQLRELSETLPELSISLPKGRSIGRVWKLSETLPKGRVSGFVPDAATLGSSVIEFLLGQVLIFFVVSNFFFEEDLRRISHRGWFWDTLKNPTMDFRL
ncbi:hypothetical protein [Leptospira santarosai]|uniref:Uncharacterized protein n=1 Tax=Leptospira santarosai serovar Shermani str. LT 821 TaxID=758847 RepID=K8YDY8_9LEPT|nr:hypothetical protein [Leptospira santarosai]EKT87700.2 hypothetical protein LSS_06290 [Leptospira santarosai serovar Shermani str. LT 821]